uniref:V-type proton ATPase subunit C 2 isoform X7 n=1 Tax=Callithrix jacchus TaxID=9483 RepID=UPI0023DD0744|nr:V-type proton ATPase subunit C 2 isoform X7 [Callithrix jacchus]
MSEFWLISAPGDRENLQALERMNTVTSKSHLSYNTKFAIPDFKVGTLDSLVGLSDELGKLDTFAESLIRRMAQSVVEVMEDSKGKAQEHLLANGVDLTTFVTHFEWDMAKYPAKQPLVSVVDTIAKQLAQIETDLKSRTAAYNTLKTNLENLEKKSMGNLFTRTLSDIVNKEDFVLDSEYLVTLLVIVPKPNYSQWQKTYESLSDMVVPRSTKLITEDKEGGLFTVTLFRKVIEDFKSKARENKFTVREFYYDEKEIKREREEMARLLSDKKQQYQTSCVALKKGSSTFPDHKVKVTPLGNPDRPAAGQSDRERESEGEGEGPLLRWLKVNFSEAFIAWIHIKALRVFVESVLRHLWRSRDCNSVIKTIFLMSTSISTLVFLTRKASWHLSHVRADCYSHLFPLARECLTCLIELRFFSEKLLTKVSDSCIYFFLSYNKMLSSPLNVLTNSKFHFSECFT